MRLSELLKWLVIREVRGDPDVEVSFAVDDSRAVRPGSVFIAFRGQRTDGHRHARQAVENGAVAVVVEEPVDVPATQVIVPSTRRVAPIVAHAVFGFPARDMTMVGVTGTNGKTTTTTLIEQILIRAGKETGLIGTIEQRTSRGEVRGSGMTTPESAELARVLREMRDQGAECVVMEVSSHAIELGRVAGIPFRVAVFTNLTQDHLDFHGTLEAYGRAKGKLFSRLGNAFAVGPDGGLPVAVLNADDPWSREYAADTVQQVVTFGIDREADVRASDVRIAAESASFRLESFAGTREVSLRMTGRFSVYNALAAAAAGLALGVPFDTVASALESVQGVPGRFERVDAGQPFTILVDYSHTPDSLENALRTVREFCRGRVFTVVGCGGDRDRGKRPRMAKIAAQYSDVAVLTSDNPRTEDPECILDEMEAGIRDLPGVRYVRLVSRRDGIRYAIENAVAGDVVLIAGKGHETYQIIGTVRHDFDDREVAASIVREGP